MNVARIISALAVLAGLSRGARADELASTGPLAIRAPAGLVLGRDATAVVHAKAEAGVSFVASAGAIGDAVVENGELRATLTLPAERFPQLAIVAAVAADGSVRDWLAIPLAGQARVKVDTDRKASVVVRVGSAEFGPVRADARGTAWVDIVVPPGIPTATTIATGANGAVREKPLPLNVRPFARTLAVCAPLGDRVSVIATTASGAPAPSPPTLTAAAAELAAPTTISPGVFVAERRIDVSADTAELVATFAGEESVAAKCTLHVPPEPPRAMRVVAERPQFVAGSGPVALAIAFDYPGARPPLEISTVALDVDVGTASTVERTEHGLAAAWTLPDAFAGRRVAHASARVKLPGGTQLAATVEIELVAAAPTTIDASTPARLRANGSATGTIVARVLDRFGNPIPARKLDVHARGRVGAFAAQPDGGEAASYVAPRTREPGDDVVELTDPASGLSRRATIRLDALPRELAFSARVGYLSNFGRVTTPLAAIAAEARLPILDDRVVAGVEVLGYSTSFTVAAMDTGEPLAARVTVVPALARLAYRGSLGPIDLWLGGGAGAAFASLRLASASTGTQTGSATRFAAIGCAGGALHAGPGWLLVEAAYLHATLADGPLAGRIGGLVATVGFAVER